MSRSGDFCQDSFWDSALTIDGSWPQFTECFQDTALVWLPCGFLWLCAPIYMWYLVTSPVGASGNTCNKKFLAKLICAICLIVISVIKYVYTYETSHLYYDHSKFMASVVFIVTLILTLVFIVAEKRNRFVTSGVLFIFWTLLLVSNIIPFYSLIELEIYKVNKFQFLIFYIKYCFIVVEFFLHCFPDKPVASVETEKIPNPEAQSSFLSRMTFSWVTRTVLIGYKTPLTKASVPDLHSREKSASVVPRFITRWTKAVKRVKSRQTDNDNEIEFHYHSPLLINASPVSSQSEVTSNAGPTHLKKAQHKWSLACALFKTFWLECFISQVWKVFYDILLLCNPLLLGQLVAFIQDPTEASWKGYVLALTLFVSSSLQSFFFNQLFHQSTNLGLRIRAALISTIFIKSLKTRNFSSKESTTGEVVNLMSVDTDHIQDLIGVFWTVWSSPLQIVVCLYILYERLGMAIFSGVGFLVLIIPVNGYLCGKIGKMQEKLLAYKDQRVKLMTEMLNGIKIIKLFAWEENFEKKVVEIRNEELKILYKFALLESVFSFSWSVAPYLVALLTFLTFVFISDDHYLDPQTAFMAMSLYDIMRFSINFAPMVITDTLKAVVSAKRIENYLCIDELDEGSVTNDENAECPISITNGHFRWTSEGPDILQDINVTISDESLVAVVGPVGSGKSSLLSAMLGEMEKMCGKVVMRGSVSYVPQKAWIQNNTLRNNILFGKNYDPEFYNQCLEACALGPDLQMLPNGDHTEIGEKGINLSGGQKQRVSLARAIYSQSDIYLLDDPLSAVDSHVGKHIFNQVLSDTGLLAGKVTVLVTHGLHWLPHTDHVIVISDGKVTESGHYENLLSHRGDFAQLVTSFLLQTDDDQLNANNDEFQDLKWRVLRTLSEPENEVSDVAINKPSNDVLQKIALKGKKGKDRLKQVEENKFKRKEIVDAKSGNNLIEEEAVEIGTVKRSVVKSYVSSFGFWYLLIVVFLYVIYIGSDMGSLLWLTEWTDDPSLGNFTKLPRNSTERMRENAFYVTIYGVFGLIQTTAVLIDAIIANTRAVQASRVLHQSMLSRILHAPMSFFDTTPVGRIINRFSKDLTVVDEELPVTFQAWLDCVLTVLASIMAISYGTPIFLAAILPLSVLYFFCQRFYIPASRQLKRLSSKTKSPIFNHFSETLTGASVIRAFGAQKRFVQESEDRVDAYQIYDYFNNSCNRWLSIRLELVGSLLILCAATIAVVSRDNVSPGIMGLLISYSLQLTDELNWMVRMTSLLETEIVAVERIKEYSEVDIEAPWFKLDDQRPLLWPQEGIVQVEHLSLRYRPGLELVLKDVSFTVQAGEKLGIVGRTGSGKSSLTLAIFRLLEPAGGAILIDGVNISSLGLHDLRSKITILPQTLHFVHLKDPVIFSGTLHQNLDPCNDYTVDELWKVVRLCHLEKFILTTDDKLEHQCGEGGEHLSYGQRQLVCLGRALLCKTKILILDEATAAVDMETDEVLQRTIREELTDCTVMTIAHRLKTVMDYDRILVLDKGEVNDIDTPANLLKKKDGLFYSMAKTANIVN